MDIMEDDAPPITTAVPRPLRPHPSTFSHSALHYLVLVSLGFVVGGAFVYLVWLGGSSAVPAPPDNAHGAASGADAAGAGAGAAAAAAAAATGTSSPTTADALKLSLGSSTGVSHNTSVPSRSGDNATSVPTTQLHSSSSQPRSSLRASSSQPRSSVSGATLVDSSADGTTSGGAAVSSVTRDASSPSPAPSATLSGSGSRASSFATTVSAHATTSDGRTGAVTRDAGSQQTHMPWLSSATAAYRDACVGPAKSVDADSMAVRAPALVQAHRARVDDYAKKGPACTAEKVLYPRDRYLAAQYSVDALVPQFQPSEPKTKAHPAGCMSSCGLQLADAPRTFKWYSRKEARALIERLGSVLVVGDSLGRRQMYQLAEMLSKSPSQFRDNKDADRFRTVNLGMKATLSFEWSPQLAGIIKHFRRRPQHVRKCKVLLLSLGIHDMWDERKKNYDMGHREEDLRHGYLDELVSLIPPTTRVILLMAPLPGHNIAALGKEATNEFLLPTRNAARRIGLPMLDPYWWMMKVGQIS